MALIAIETIYSVFSAIAAVLTDGFGWLRVTSVTLVNLVPQAALIRVETFYFRHYGLTAVLENANGMI